jgi:hypothetical protein
MPMISVEFDLPLPNDFLVDHSQSEGKSRKYTYHGPEKIYLLISKETGRETAGPWTEEDKKDGRPVPIDSYLYEVDCTENPLVCQLRAPIVDELQETRNEDEIFHPLSPEIEGYERLSYSLPLMPDDVFDPLSVRIENDTVVFDARSLTKKLIDKDESLTWDDIRKHRDMMLKGSDSAIAEDMPESIKDQWKEYRQKLRDFPKVMQDNGVIPNVAYYMFPTQPDS